MTRDSIIALADKWTEKKGAQFDLQKIYEFTCQHICKQNRFWWRQKWITFNMSIGVPTYDITSISTTPALVQTGIEEVITWSIITSGNPPSTKLTPIFDEESVFAMLEATATVQPSRYVMGVDDLNILRVDPPDSAYKTRMSFWAIPNFTDDTTLATVPLIPAWYHNTIAEGMAAEVLENSYGLQDVKASTMRARYQASLIDMQMRPRFTTDYVQSFSISTDDAIQST